MFNPDEFPNRPDYAAMQTKWLARWEDGNYFHAEPDDRQPFSIVIPPPNVTGALHLGHALNNTLQDIVIRFRRMQGYNAMWMPGTDHAGIATQAVVERRLLEEENKTRHDLGREALVERIWDWKQQYEKRIIGQLKQMGFSCDWDRLRFTLDDTCAKAVRQTFFDFFQKGLIYRGKRLVNWDTYLQTAVSDDEVENKTVKGHFWHFRYPVIEPQQGEPEFVTIATTRPETMLGDTAVAVHPDPSAALAKLEAELIEKHADGPAKDRDAVQAQIDEVRRRQEEMLPQLEKLRDMALDGRLVELPLTGRQIPLVADDWAKPELGSGCVKITPAHDENDYAVWQRNPDIGAINIMQPDGTLNENVPEKYRGQTMKDARAAVVADLTEQGFHNPETDVEDRDIELPHSDRSKKPIEPYLADQWFLKMDHLAQTAIDAVTSGKVKIIPERYTKGYLDWLSEKRDWPIGRQLWWGHRIPIWTTECWQESTCESLIADLKGQPSFDADLISIRVDVNEERQALLADESKNASFARITMPYATLHICLLSDIPEFEAYLSSLTNTEYTPEGDENQVVPVFEQSEEVLDTWFSSALWPHSTMGWPEQTDALAYWYPTSVLITSRDIITLWVARMVLAGLNNMGEIPFKEVYIHPKILDGYGETMSKSKGNGVDPLDVIDKFGADALRYGLAFLATEQQDVRMPVQFECPHCGQSMDQTKKNRELPRVECKHCGQAFSTQWAREEADTALPRGAVISERYEIARNFCNKLWNASRFAMLQLEGYEAAPVSDEELAFEDRWILSRLSETIETMTDCYANYKYAEAARAIYSFTWDDFCDFYVEMVKLRLDDETARPAAQRVLVFVLDQLLRMLHPIIPFITEEVWELLGKFASQRGLAKPTTPAEVLMTEAWPESMPQHRDEAVEAQMDLFKEVLRAVRDVRSQNNIPPKESVDFAVRCAKADAERLTPLAGYFSLAPAVATTISPEAEAMKLSATKTLGGVEVYVDLTDFIDIEKEIARLTKEADHKEKLIAGKEKKLNNEKFTANAPAEVVEKERENLKAIQAELATLRAAINDLRELE